MRKIKEAGINASFKNSSIRLADAACPPVKQVLLNIPMNAVLAFLLSALIAVASAVFFDLLDNTVLPKVSPKAFNVSVLLDAAGEELEKEAVGGDHERDHRYEPLAPATDSEDLGASQFTESMRTLRNNILLADFDRRLRVILVTSPSPSEGKSTVAAHLAIAHAEQGRKTLLIDGDLRRPSIHRKFDFTPSSGLSSVLLNGVKWPQVLFKPEHAGLDILAAGPPSRRASDLIGSNITELLEQISQEYDLVIVDARRCWVLPKRCRCRPARMAS